MPKKNRLEMFVTHQLVGKGLPVYTGTYILSLPGKVTRRGAKGPVRLKAVLFQMNKLLPFFKYQVNELSVPLRRATRADYLRYAGETLRIVKKVSESSGQQGERRKKVKLGNR